MATINQRTAAPRRLTNDDMLQRGRRAIAGGDSSTMRVLPYHQPLVADRGEGSRVWDVEGREYIDLNMAYGPLIFGHRSEKIIDAVSYQINKFGSQLGFPTEISIRVAEKLKRLFPGMELVRFSSTGTEAIASAIRLARAYTERSKIIAFEGQYHGWSDVVFHRYHAALDDLPQRGFGPALPGTRGMNGAPRDLIVVEWNNPALLKECLDEHGDEVAAVITEPVSGNCGVIPPEPGFLESLRELTTDCGALLIFDEVITGLRIAAGGAQEHYGVDPDITIVSKALGGGFPVAAFGARREIMELIVRGEVFHGGVYSGNAAVMAACDAVLDEVLAKGEAIYRGLHAIGDELARGLDDVLARYEISHLVQHVGPMVSLFLTTGTQRPLLNYRQVRRACDFESYIRFQHAMQQRGVYFHPNQFEPMFLSTAHTSEDVGLVLERVEDACQCGWQQ
jgi:glutamate-1-semialdehyde 2,1-aminomutase